MSDQNNYLEAILDSQRLNDDGEELKLLRKHRKEVERILRAAYGNVPTIRYGGSYAKGTMIKEAYDLDIICYFPHDNTLAGETLKAIYENVETVLADDYYVQRKTSVLRLKDKRPDHYMEDFHIDVAPGRYIDGDDGDVFLYQAGGDKDCLKTNLQVHIDHIKNSGVLDALCLIKLWRARNNIQIKQFVLDMLVIKLLRTHKDDDLASQLLHIWTEFRDNPDQLAVVDPANPSGNDLKPVLDAHRYTLSHIAQTTLNMIENIGWQAVFGQIEESNKTNKHATLKRMAASVTVPTKPWFTKG